LIEQEKRPERATMNKGRNTKGCFGCEGDHKLSVCPKKQPGEEFVCRVADLLGI